MVVTSAVTARGDRRPVVVLVVVHITVAAAAADELLLGVAAAAAAGGRRARRLRLFVDTAVRRLFVGRELAGFRSDRRRAGHLERRRGGGRRDGLRPDDGQIVRDGSRRQ